MENKDEKMILCEDVVAILKALKIEELDPEEIEILKDSILEKISLHIADCENCLSVVEDLGLSVLKKAE